MLQPHEGRTNTAHQLFSYWNISGFCNGLPHFKEGGGGEACGEIVHVLKNTKQRHGRTHVADGEIT